MVYRGWVMHRGWMVHRCWMMNWVGCFWVGCYWVGYYWAGHYWGLISKNTGYWTSSSFRGRGESKAESRGLRVCISFHISLFFDTDS